MPTGQLSAPLTEPRELVKAIERLLHRTRGVNLDEALTAMEKAYPDRTREDLEPTVRTQLNRHATVKRHDQKRGLVYSTKRRKA
jgi:hypothetical protein